MNDRYNTVNMVAGLIKKLLIENNLTLEVKQYGDIYALTIIDHQENKTYFFKKSEDEENEHI